MIDISPGKHDSAVAASTNAFEGKLPAGKQIREQPGRGGQLQGQG